MKKTIKTLTATATLTLAGFLASGQTFADEVKPVEPEQPKEETQATTVAENVVTQDTTKINEAVEEAKKEELEVTKTEKTEYVLSEETAKQLNEEKQKELDQKAKEIKEKTEAYSKQKAEYDKVVEEVKNETKIDEQGGDVLYGSPDESKAGTLEYYKNFKLVSDNADNNISTLKEELHWGDNIKIEAEKDITVSKDGDTFYKLTDFKKGSQFWIRNIAETVEDGVLDALVTMVDNYELSGTEAVPHYFTVSKNGDSFSFIFYNGKTLPLKFTPVDKKGNKVVIPNATVVTDVDWGQGSEITYSEKTFKNYVPANNGLTEVGNEVKDTTNLSHDLDSAASTPDGTYVTAGIGDITVRYHSHSERVATGEAWDRQFLAGDGSGTAFTLFGRGTTLQMTVKPKKPKFDYSLTKYEYLNITPEKAVEKVIDGDNVDGSTIQYNEVFYYHLKGGLVPANRSEALNEYAFVDDYDENGDKYNDKYTVKLVKDVTLKDGTVLKAGTDVTEFTTALTEAGKVTINFKSDFLEKVSDSSAFQSDSYLEFTRINYGTFENTYVNKVNGKEFKSNTVKTTTPPQTPEQPKPQQPKSELPNTGTASTVLSSVVGLMSLGLGGVLIKSKKEN